LAHLTRKEEIVTSKIAAILYTLVKRHPLISYFALTFAISWGGILALTALGGLLSANQFSPLLYLAALAGPSSAGLAMTALVGGQAGLRELGSRLLAWRAGAQWYVAALLIAPISLLAALFALSLTSPLFLPGIVTTDDKVSLLATGLVAGLMTGICEELGWTGFAIPHLRMRYGMVAGGLILGVLWGAWHFPLFVGSGASTVLLPAALSLSVLLFSFLPPVRILMVWVYDRSGSLPLAMLMHASLTASTLILQPVATSAAAVRYDLVWAALLWGLVGAVALINRGHLSQQPQQPQAA
jgi:membrane protease YdiL (CAAX protease family)